MLCRGTLSSRLFSRHLLLFSCHGVVKGNALEL
jgi:hypothetical protein